MTKHKHTQKTSSSNTIQVNQAKQKNKKKKNFKKAAENAIKSENLKQSHSCESKLKKNKQSDTISEDSDSNSDQVNVETTEIKNDEKNIEVTNDEIKVESDNDEVETEAPKVKKVAPVKIPPKKRYVLFVGNLPYNVAQNEIREHFRTVGQIRDVRIPKEKGSNRPKGIAFLELENEEQYKKAFSFHGTFMNGRKINVLYSNKGMKSEDAVGKKKILKKVMKLQAMRDKGILDPKARRRAAKRQNKRQKKEKRAKAEQERK